LAIIGDWVFSIQLETVLLALGFSLVVGVVFGVWPARTAAKLEPIDALRFE
jgi:ABC-type antimicrobial peptide transport system permease subunit